MAKLRFMRKHNEYQIDYYHNGIRLRRYLGSDKKNAEKELKRVDAFVKAQKLGFELQPQSTSSHVTLDYILTATSEKTPDPQRETTRITRTEAIGLYLERCKGAVTSGNLTKKTYEGKSSLLNGRFSGFLNQKFPELIFMDEIQKIHIESYRSYRINSRHKNARNRRIKPTSFNNDLRELIAFFNYCIENDKTFHIHANPASKVKKVQKADKNEPPPCLTLKQIKELLHECKNDTELRRVIQAFLDTAMRYNELRNLRWQDVNLEKKFITIKSRKDFQTKSRKSRTIPMSQKMSELLHETPKRSEKVFDFNDIQKIKAKKDSLCNIRKRFERIKRQLSFLHSGQRFHIFRHTAITRWANSGVPLPIVQKWVGHSSIEMTMKYVHPSEEESAQWMKKYSDFTQFPNIV